MTAEKSTILLIDDDRSLLRALRIGLRARGYRVVEARNAHDGITQASLSKPDAIVLDLGLPDQDGIDVCRQIRTFTQAPVIVLSAAGSEQRKVSALDAGADDYVTKPFGMAELEARLRVALRRSVQRSEANVQVQSELVVGTLHVDLIHRMAQVEGVRLELTSREFDLLAYLSRHTGKICTHQMILAEVWGTQFLDEPHYVRVYIHKLRRKLAPNGPSLITRSGVGYELTAEED